MQETRARAILKHKDLSSANRIYVRQVLACQRLKSCKRMCQVLPGEAARAAEAAEAARAARAARAEEAAARAEEAAARAEEAAARAEEAAAARRAAEAEINIIQGLEGLEGPERWAKQEEAINMYFNFCVYPKKFDANSIAIKRVYGGEHANKLLVRFKCDEGGGSRNLVFLVTSDGEVEKYGPYSSCCCLDMGERKFRKVFGNGYIKKVRSYLLKNPRQRYLLLFLAIALIGLSGFFALNNPQIQCWLDVAQVYGECIGIMFFGFSVVMEGLQLSRGPAVEDHFRRAIEKGVGLSVVR